MSGIGCLILALAVPAEFDAEKSLFWLWLLVPAAMGLGVTGMLYFPFIFAPKDYTGQAFRVTRLPRTVAILLTVGSWYLSGWLCACAGENGCSFRISFLPGVLCLAFAGFILRLCDRSARAGRAGE
jgi:hypothetical protein